MPDFRQRARRAVSIAGVYGYETEFERDDSLLAELFDGDLDDVSDDELAGVSRYLVIATEAEAEADNAEFFTAQTTARKMMTRYAREGWFSTLWDLDEDRVVFERILR